MTILIIIIIVCISLGCVLLLHRQGVIDKKNKKRHLEETFFNLVRLEDKDSKVTIKIGDVMQYSHPVHGSVGLRYRIECDTAAFKLTCVTNYDNPKDVEMGLCGGDSAVQICALQALKKGKFKIKVIHEFRSDIKRVITYTITVK